MQLGITDFKEVLTTAMQDAKGIGADLVEKVRDKYAPRLAALGTNEDPEQERDDILTNAAIDLADAGVDAESEGAKIVMAVVSVAANIVLKALLA